MVALRGTTYTTILLPDPDVQGILDMTGGTGWLRRVKDTWRKHCMFSGSVGSRRCTRLEDRRVEDKRVSFNFNSGNVGG